VDLAPAHTFPMTLVHPVRVGYCIDSFDIGGTELNAVRTVEALDRQRFVVTVFHLHENGPLRARYEALGVRLIHLPIGRLYSPRTALQGLRFMRLLHREAIQVVHTHDLYTNIFAAPWARLGGCRVIASRRWLDSAPRPGLTPLNRWSYRFAHRVLTNSALVGKSMVAKDGVPATRVIELPNFVEERAFRRLDAETRSAQRCQWGVPRGAFVAGAVARLAPVKNHEMLIRALPLLTADVHVVLVGDGPSRHALEELARQLQVESRVHFAGQVLGSTNLHQFLDVSVLCSRSEGFPNALIEALAAACPVVATAVGGIPEVIVDGRTGLLVPVDDVQALARRLQELRRDTALRARLTACGLAAVRIKYHQSVVIAQLEALYQELAGHAVKGSAILS
jgi:glycosyltransferase involved in cell wall biosynthesis